MQVVIEDEKSKKLDGCLLGSFGCYGNGSSNAKGKFFEIQKGSVNVLRKIFIRVHRYFQDVINADGENIHDNKVLSEASKIYEILKLLHCGKKYEKIFR